MSAYSYTQTTPAETRDLTSLVESSIRTGQQLADIRRPEGGDIPFVVVPGGSQVHSLEGLVFPDGRIADHIKQRLTLHDATSFNGYVKAFHNETTRVFAHRPNNSLTAYIDYHDGTATLLDHVVTLTLKTDERWERWIAMNTKPMTQTDFAEFLEDNALDIVEPASARMLEIARDVHASKDAVFDSKIRLDSGEIQMSYTETIKTTTKSGSLEIPREFTLSLPVYQGEPNSEVTARLRYRLQDGRLTFHYKLNNPLSVHDKAFDRAVAAIAGELKMDVFRGVVG